KKARHLAAHLLDGLAHAREGGNGGRGDRRIVEADDRDLFWYSTLVAAEHLERAGRHHVGGAEDGVEVGVPFEQGLHRPGTALLSEVSGLLPGLVGLETRLAEGVVIALQAVDACPHVERAGDRGDVP